MFGLQLILLKESPYNKFRIRMDPQIEKQILGKITTLMSKIKTQLRQNGLSQQQVALFFAERIFKIKYVASQQQNKQELIKIQLEFWLAHQSQSKASVKESLIELLMNLEIENEKINQYETYQPQKLVTVKLNLKKQSQANLLETPSLKKREVNSFWQKLQQDEKQVKQPSASHTPPFSLLRDFEKELNESLLKTKMLKRLIQQKITQQLSDSLNSRSRQLHNMLALQTN